MEVDEYKDNEKILYRTKGKLSIPNKEPEDVECVIAEGHVVIEAEEHIKIPLLQIKNHQVSYKTSEMPRQDATAKLSDTLMLTYLDHLNQKQRLSLETSEAAFLNMTLISAIQKAKEQWLESLPIEERCVGFWRRLAASLLDSLILTIFSWILGFILSFFPYWLGLIVGIAFLVGSIIYYPAFWVWQGATPGKMMMGVKIVKTDGSPIGIGTAILRYIGYFVSALIIYIGYLMIAWDSRKQGLHDKIASTLVIRVG